MVAKLPGLHVGDRSSAGNLASGHPDPRVLVLARENWHRGVLGLTAGRIAQKYHRPTLVMAIEGDRCIGSGRSIPTVNLHAQLERVSDCFSHFGGHEFACGFSLPLSKLDELRERLNAVFDELDESLFVRAARVDGELELRELDREFIATHEMFEPFGAGNPQPLFMTRRSTVVGTRPFAEDCCELTIESGGVRAPAVLWPSVKQLADEIVKCGVVDLLYTIEPDSYAPNGAKLIVADARRAE
jgi:single-stranded-DNA-specific exonuclease